MMFIELFVPKGVFSAERRRSLGARLINEVMQEGGAPQSVTDGARVLCQAVVHEPEVWVVGGPPVDPADPPRYVVRVSVPNSWRKPMSEHVVSCVTRVLAEEDGDPERFRREPHAWVHVVGVPDGSYGAFGRVLDDTELVKVMTRTYRESGERDAAPEPPPGTALDPVCGMTVATAGAGFRLEHEGSVHFFCSAGCRTVFREELEAVG